MNMKEAKKEGKTERGRTVMKERDGHDRKGRKDEGVGGR